MKCYVGFKGDRSVGIDDQGYTIDLGDFVDADLLEGDRTGVRSILAEAFGSIAGDSCSLMFEDECGDCGSICEMTSSGNYECGNANCIRNDPHYFD